MVLKSRYFLSLILLIGFLLSACGIERNYSLELPETNLEGQTPAPEPSPLPERVLSICLEGEPTSLFLYGDQSTSAKIIRQAIYDGPVDEVDFEFYSPLLEEIPSLANGLVSVVSVEVNPGERIVDSKGNLSILASGVEYRPSGCSDTDCWETYQNQTPVILDQVEITFPVKTGLTWSDGIPLSPDDSVFSYQIARELYGSTGPLNLRFTADYEAVDESTILWKGIPGYLGIYSYPEFYFSPLPEHFWADLSVTEMLTSNQTTQQPLGWGPYRIVEWIAGDHITLIQNDAYYLIGEGLPAFDALVFRFVEGAEEALAAYSSGECEIVANISDLFDYLPELQSLEQEGEVRLNFIEGGAWEQISFGINSLDSKRVYLKDPRTRQAIAQCINRERITTNRGDAGLVVNSFYHPDDPRSNINGSTSIYQPQEAADLLEEIGWIDHDLDQNTLRIAESVDDVKDGTQFQLSLLVVGEGIVPPTATLIKDDLGACGIEVLIENLPASELLAPGPEGPVFGRRFDLALFAWSTGHYHLCRIFTSDEIPGLYPVYPKGWGGANASGYSNESYDAECSLIHTTLPDLNDTQDALMKMQTIFTDDLPVLPLFFRREIILSDPLLEGFQSGSYLPLWNIDVLK
jgi:peptide/nickel transport system substrate-binding protein